MTSWILSLGRTFPHRTFSFSSQLRPLPHPSTGSFSPSREAPYAPKSFLRIRIKIKAELPHLFPQIAYDLGKPLSFARGDPIEKDSLGSNTRHLKQTCGSNWIFFSAWKFPVR